MKLKCKVCFVRSYRILKNKSLIKAEKKLLTNRNHLKCFYFIYYLPSQKNPKDIWSEFVEKVEFFSNKHKTADSHEFHIKQNKKNLKNEIHIIVKIVLDLLNNLGIENFQNFQKLQQQKKPWKIFSFFYFVNFFE